MDGLLLDTEPLWGVSMLRVAEKNGIGITKDRFKETRGLRVYEVTEHWHRNIPWEGKSALEVAEDILDDIIGLAKEKATIMPGVTALLDTLDKEGFKIGLASSSPLRMIEALVTHFSIRERFHCITSADAVEFGKPHPAVFLHCANSLKSKPHECVVLEDSINGMIAGKAARMKVIAVPEEIHFEDPRFSLADLKLRSLEYLDLETLKKL